MVECRSPSRRCAVTSWCQSGKITQCKLIHCCSRSCASQKSDHKCVLIRNTELAETAELTYTIFRYATDLFQNIPKRATWGGCTCAIHFSLLAWTPLSFTPDFLFCDREQSFGAIFSEDAAGFSQRCQWFFGKNPENCGSVGEEGSQILIEHRTEYS